MVRTKADCSGIKVSGAKAPRKIVNIKPDDRGSSSSGSGQYSGGNPYKPQPTPGWQKEITTFFLKDQSSECKNENHTDGEESAGSTVEERKC